ncbi:MAG: C39 family peptidase [Candidatus Altiarchaeota archaeon]
MPVTVQRPQEFSGPELPVLSGQEGPKPTLDAIETHSKEVGSISDSFRRLAEIVGSALTSPQIREGLIRLSSLFLKNREDSRLIPEPKNSRLMELFCQGSSDYRKEWNRGLVDGYLGNERWKRGDPPPCLKQENMTSCAYASVRMGALRFGRDISEDEFDRALPESNKSILGCSPDDIKKALEKLGYSTYSLAHASLMDKIEVPFTTTYASVEALLKTPVAPKPEEFEGFVRENLRKGRSVVVATMGHARLMTGIDDEYVSVNDPSDGTAEKYELKDMHQLTKYLASMTVVAFEPIGEVSEGMWNQERKNPLRQLTGTMMGLAGMSLKKLGEKVE